MNCKNFQNWLSKKKIHTAPPSPEVQEHITDCAACAQMYALDSGLDNIIRSEFEMQTVPDSLYEQVEMSLDHAIPPRRISRLKSAVIVAACALFFAAVFTISHTPFRYENLQQLSEKAIESHIKGNTTMTFSSEETAKALVMLSRELKFKVIIPELKEQGYILLGGRLCALGKCKIAYLFYEKENKISSLVIMDYDHLNFQMADGSRFSNDIKGYHTDIWKENDQVYAMVY